MELTEFMAELKKSLPKDVSFYGDGQFGTFYMYVSGSYEQQLAQLRRIFRKPVALPKRRKAGRK